MEGAFLEFNQLRSIRHGALGEEDKGEGLALHGSFLVLDDQAEQFLFIRAINEYAVCGVAQECADDWHLLDFTLEQLLRRIEVDADQNVQPAQVIGYD